MILVPRWIVQCNLEMSMKFGVKAKILTAALCVATILAIPYYIGAATGDRMVVTTVACSGNMCTETTTVYEQRVDGSYVIISTSTRSYPRKAVEK